MSDIPGGLNSELYTRRRFLKSAGLFAGGSILTACTKPPSLDDSVRNAVLAAVGKEDEIPTFLKGITYRVELQTNMNADNNMKQLFGTALHLGSINNLGVLVTVTHVVRGENGVCTNHLKVKNFAGNETEYANEHFDSVGSSFDALNALRVDKGLPDKPSKISVYRGDLKKDIKCQTLSFPNAAGGKPLYSVLEYMNAPTNIIHDNISYPVLYRFKGLTDSGSSGAGVFIETSNGLELVGFVLGSNYNTDTGVNVAYIVPAIPYFDALLKNVEQDKSFHP